MIATLLIAIAAGCTSALMFASLVSGALISLLLFWLAPLPLMMAGLGWGPLTASVGGIAAALGLGAIFGLPYCITFVIMVALPAWWLGHLALLGRPIADPNPDSGPAPSSAKLEWYPVGRNLLWIAGFAVLTTMAALLTLGTDAAGIAAAMKRGLMRVLDSRTVTANGDMERVVDAMVAVAPLAAVIVTMISLTINLWLAALITATSGRLRRPWPDLRATALPAMTLVASCVAIALCFTSGLLAILAQVITTALMVAYALTGFAVLHTVTQSLNSRAFWLSCAYVVVVIFTWPVVAMVMLGIADALFGLRQRYLRSRPPPLPAS
ncbi:DUF2232 domain-containing protein [Bradyrhizobium cenepequi]|uniref:DUF2232 domain-containing protein n=1 Tax=Bradyrhizobium cenepequi TaxID=2821403 RepID=UPI001CE2D217|nr:DUF2232 domain-containing protein [Bradyrhizobium cenepequi]MCA6107394.1 DUF2232 domain-containing protein [Bradyrhizobium cenepequi]